MKRVWALLFAAVCLLLSACGAAQAEGTTPQSQEEPAADASSIVFYNAPAKEFADPGGKTFLPLTKRQVQTLQAMVDGVGQWMDDNLVDRLAFSFNGYFTLSDREAAYYFSYDQNVLYCDHYYAEVSAGQMQQIRAIAQAYGLESRPEGGTNRDPWGLTMGVTFQSATVLDVSFTHDAKTATEIGVLTTTPAYEIRGLYQGETLALGDYIRNVLHLDYTDRTFLFDSQAVIIQPNGSLTLSCDLEATYGALPVGEYVFCRDVSLTTEMGEVLTKTYMVPFAVTD